MDVSSGFGDNSGAFEGHFRFVPDNVETCDEDWDDGLAAAFELGWVYGLQDENYLDFESPDGGGLSVEGRHIVSRFPPEGVWGSVVPLTSGLAACLYAFLEASRMRLVLSDGSATLTATGSTPADIVISSSTDLYRHLAPYSQEPHVRTFRSRVLWWLLAGSARSYWPMYSRRLVIRGRSLRLSRALAGLAFAVAATRTTWIVRRSKRRNR